jgi:hypothetical protein
VAGTLPATPTLTPHLALARATTGRTRRDRVDVTGGNFSEADNPTWAQGATWVKLKLHPHAVDNAT